MSCKSPERVVARDQRALGRCHRHVILALGVLAVDQQRAGEPDRDLRDAHKLLDVAVHDRWIERVTARMLERGAGALANELGSPRGRLACVVVIAVTRNRLPMITCRAGLNVPPPLCGDCSLCSTRVADDLIDDLRPQRRRQVVSHPGDDHQPGIGDGGGGGAPS
jgi:hypothetical protein